MIAMPRGDVDILLFGAASRAMTSTVRASSNARSPASWHLFRVNLCLHGSLTTRVCVALLALRGRHRFCADTRAATAVLLFSHDALCFVT